MTGAETFKSLEVRVEQVVRAEMHAEARSLAFRLRIDFGFGSQLHLPIPSPGRNALFRPGAAPKR